MPEIPSIEGLISKINELVMEIRASRETGAGDTTGPRRILMPDMSGLKTGMDSLGKRLGELATEGGGILAVFKAVAKDKDALMSVFESIATKSKIPGATTAVKTVSAAVQNTVQSTKFGADTDAEVQARQEATNRVDYITLFKNMQATGTGGSSLGGTTGEKLDNINKTLTKLNLDSAQRFKGGTTTPDILAQALIISQSRSTGNLGNERDQDRAAINAGKLADEIDKAATASDRSREEVATELAGRMKNNQYMLAQFGTNEELRQSYIRSQAALSRHGQAVQDLSDDFIKFGGATEKTQGTLLALGPAGMELRSAMMNLKNATNEKERQDAEAQVRAASIKIDTRQNDPRMARMAAMADAFPELKQLQGAKTQFEQNRSAAGQSYFTNQGMSPEAARSAQDAQIRNRQEGKDRLDRPLTAGQAVVQLDMIANRDAAIGAGIAWGKLNEVLKGSVEPITKLTNSLDKFVPKQVLEPGELNKTSNTEKNKAQYGFGQTPPVSKDIGTLGTTGQTFEPKDIIALLHKDERVLNPKENKDLTNLYEMIGNLKSKGSAGKTEETPDVATDVASAKPEESGTDNITLKDVHDSLQRLNNTMEVMASHTADMKDTNRTTADMSQKMTGNRFAV